MTDIAPINWLRISALGVIWGAAFMSTTVALEGTGPLTLVAVRLCLGAVLLLTINLARGKSVPSFRAPAAGRLWMFIFAMAMLSNAVPFAFLSWGQQFVASGFAGVCMAVVPLFTLPLAHFLVAGERMTLRRVVGFGLGTVGVFVLIGPGAFASTGADFELLARLACVGAAACYAMGSICTRLSPKTDLLELAAATLTVAALIFTPYALYTEGWPAWPEGRSLWALIYLGLLPTGIAQIILIQVIKDAGPVFMGLVNYMVPVWSVIFGITILSEPLPPSLLLAMALILSGVGISQYGPLKRLFTRSA
ncbi:MAG: DMT family transporter [Pseudomonadota bacterium]